MLNYKVTNKVNFMVQGVTKRMDSLTYYIMLGGLILFWPPCRISQIMIFNHVLQALQCKGLVLKVGFTPKINKILTYYNAYAVLVANIRV